MIVVVYTYQEFLLENLYFLQVADAVKSGIRMPEGNTLRVQFLPCHRRRDNRIGWDTFCAVQP